MIIQFTEVIFVTRLTKGCGYPYIDIRYDIAPDFYDFDTRGSYGPLLSIDTKTTPVVFHLQSQ